MTAFAADWLALREPADRAARDPVLLARLADWVADRGRLSVLDLGCGTGATLRAVAPLLAVPQSWLLVDQDPDLLARCPEALAAATAATARVDLVAELELLPWDAVDLVTASALLDLVSADWLQRLVALAQDKAIYMALSVDGRIELAPTVADDAHILELVARHHRRDKSFGPALGHAAAAALRDLLHAAGRTAELRCADWILGPEQAALQAALLDGYAAAAAEQAPHLAEQIGQWRAARAALPEQRLRIGHRDLLSLPAVE